MKQIEILGVFVWLCVPHSIGGGGLDGCKLDFFSLFARCFGTKFQLLSDPESVRKVCNHQTLRTAMVCMDKMKEACETELRQTIETSGLTDGMALYCQNVELMANKANCMKAASSDMRTCVTTLLTDFRNKMNKRNLTMMSDPRLIMQLTCEHTEEKVECFDTKLARTCPDNVRDILNRVSRLLTKPTCTFGRYVDTPPTESSRTDTDEQRTNRSSSTGCTVMILIIVFCAKYIV